MVVATATALALVAAFEAAVAVLIHWLKRRCPWIITLADPTIQFKLGSDGKFRFPPVPPGPHTLFIACHGYKLLTQEFQLPRGATLKLEIRLIAVSAQDDPGLTVSDTITVTAERESIAPARRSPAVPSCPAPISA